MNQKTFIETVFDLMVANGVNNVIIDEDGLYVPRRVGLRLSGTTGVVMRWPIGQTFGEREFEPSDQTTPELVFKEIKKILDGG